MKTDAPGFPGKRPPTGHSQSKDDYIGEYGESKGMSGWAELKLLPEWTPSPPSSEQMGAELNDGEASL